MLNGRPHVLKGSAHLQLERNLIDLRIIGIEVEISWDAADIVKGVIAETVELVHLAFVNRIVPIYDKQFLGY